MQTFAPREAENSQENAKLCSPYQEITTALNRQGKKARSQFFYNINGRKISNVSLEGKDDSIRGKQIHILHMGSDNNK